MNENQENFLIEFHDLLQKYNIIAVYMSYHGGDKRDYRITLDSNGQKLEFSRYYDNYFEDIGTYEGGYKAGDNNR